LSDATAAEALPPVEEKEIPLPGVTRNLEVVVDGFEGVVVSIQADVANPRCRNEASDSFDHAKAGAENGYEGQFLPAHPLSGRSLERCLHRCRLQRELACRLVRNERGNLVHQLLEDLGGGRAISKERELVLDERVRNDAERRERRGGVHAAEATNFARMKEYQAVMLRLSRHARDDEDALTDLLNERSRGGWRPAMMSQDEHRLTLVFERPGDGEA
jgi:hypothetical protein